MKKLESQWPVRGSDYFEFKSKVVKDKFAIGVWQPTCDVVKKSEDNLRPLNVVYLLDGKFMLGVAVSTCTMLSVDLIKPGFPKLLLVAIDYLEGEKNQRNRDFTHIELGFSRRVSDEISGGADNFLRFIEEELDPMIRSRYNTCDLPAGILGDSFGGTFSFHAFRRQSKAFDKYWFGSPALLLTGFDYIEEVKNILHTSLVHKTEIFLSIGELETNGGYAFYEEASSNYNQLVSILTSIKHHQLRWRSKVYSGHTHSTIWVPSVNDALIYLYGPHFPQ